MTQAQPLIRQAVQSDGPAITRIDGEGLATGHASYRPDTHVWETWNATYVDGLKLVYELDGEVLGWAGVSASSSRCVYRGVGEVSIYIGAGQGGRGIGSALLEALVAASEAAGYWTLTAQIFPENPASLALHRRCGFEVLGLRKALGLMSYGPMAGQWRDVFLLERRSSVVGL